MNEDVYEMHSPPIYKHVNFLQTQTSTVLSPDTNVQRVGKADLYILFHHGPSI